MNRPHALPDRNASLESLYGVAARNGPRNGGPATKKGKRARSEIMDSILRHADISSTKTTLMRRCSLNSKQANHYLPDLVSHGLLRFEPEGRFYVTTARGRDFVRLYERFNGTKEAPTEVRKRFSKVLAGSSGWGPSAETHGRSDS